MLSYSCIMVLIGRGRTSFHEILDLLLFKDMSICLTIVHYRERNITKLF